MRCVIHSDRDLSETAIYTRLTFQALVDAIIPPTLRPAEAGGVEFAAGALQLCLDQYVIGNTDHSQFVPVDGGVPEPLSLSTARMLNVGAKYGSFPGSGDGMFYSLSREDRLRTLDSLDRLIVPLSLLPLPFRNNPALVQTMIDTLNQLTMFGYYSEWFGYGTTRLFPPDCRQLEFVPPGWRLCGYPGPAFGYRDFRGFVLRYPRSEGGASDV